MTDLRQAAQGVPPMWPQQKEGETFSVAYIAQPEQVDCARCGHVCSQRKEQEPVAYYHPRNGFYWAKPTSIFAPTVVDVPPIPLYTTAAQREWSGLTDEDWEWVADKKETSLDTFAYGVAWAADQLKERNTILEYTKRPWVGLTPEEILDLFDLKNVYGSKWIEFARTVEAALRSKNT